MFFEYTQDALVSHYTQDFDARMYSLINETTTNNPDEASMSLSVHYEDGFSRQLHGHLILQVQGL